MTDINKQKAIALFSHLANINFGYAASSKEKLMDNFNRVLQDENGDNIILQTINTLWNCSWEMAWGPALNIGHNQKKGEFHADNSLFVVKGIDASTQKKVYVVAVAGTNALSAFEEIEEDITVGKVKPWNPTDASCGNLSTGSHVGFDIVYLLPFEHNHQHNILQNTLKAFFKHEMTTHAENMEIITCGHSLGGALSPLIAVALKELSLEKGLDINVSTYPTAGPTPGDGTFAAYAERTLGKENYISMINTNDIVPMAWEHDTLINIPNVYDNEEFGHIILHPDQKRENGILKMLANLDKKTENLDYTRIAKEEEQKFEGKPQIPKSADFMTEALYQHLDVYLTEGFGFGADTAKQIQKFMKSGRS